MNRLVGAALALLSSSAIASTSNNAPSSDNFPTKLEQSEVLKRFSEAFSHNGVYGLSADVGSCYLKSGGVTENVKLCILEDVATIRMNATMQAIFVAHAIHYTAPEFFQPTAIGMRWQIYMSPTYGTVENMNAHLGTAADDIWKKGGMSPFKKPN